MNCETILSKSLPKKKAFVVKENLCFNCLTKGHVLKNCKSDFSCRIDGCSKKHHTLLHDESRVNINVSSNVSNAKVTYLQVLLIYVSNGTRSVKVNALLDSGSDSTLVTKVLADKLKLTGEDQPLTLSNAVCTSTRRMSKLVNFQISSPSHPSKILISNAWVVENLDLPRFKINSTINKQWNHLQDIQIEVDNSQEISILIGADYPHLHISKDVRIGNDNEPIAISTLLGWVLLGGKNGTNCVRRNFMVKETELLSNTVEKFWSLESYGTCQKDDVSVLPLQEQKALGTLENTIQFVDNHYSVGLLWKENKPTLPYNKSLALSRFHSLEKKFKQHPEFAEKYKSAVKDYISKGHAVILSPEEAKDRSSVTNYVPHHGVTNVNKPGKVRVVFDAAAQFDKTCLNEKLLKGPDSLNNLIGIFS